MVPTSFFVLLRPESVGGDVRREMMHGLGGRSAPPGRLDTPPAARGLQQGSSLPLRRLFARADSLESEGPEQANS